MVTFTVIGKPQPQGSTRAFMPKGARFPVVTSANKNLKPWRQDVSDNAMLAMRKANVKLMEGPVSIQCDFFFAKPKSSKKKIFKITKPDLDKAVRGIFDSLSSVVFRDDSQVVMLFATKEFGLPERVEVKVWEPLEPKV